MISSLSASGAVSPSPLERNKERRQGKDATVTVTISFDTGATGTAAEVACAANVVGRAVGSEIRVPIEGTPISGADVKTRFSTADRLEPSMSGTNTTSMLGG